MSSHNARCRQITEDELKALESAVSLINTNSIESRSWNSVHNYMTLAANVMWIMKEFPKQDHVCIGANANTVLRFYNETVAYIVKGTPRTIRVETWNGLIHDILSQWDYSGNENGGNIGTAIIRGSAGQPKTPIGAQRLGHNGIGNDLVSYAPHEILRMWSTRDKGIDDMVQSLALLAKLRRSFF